MRNIKKYLASIAITAVVVGGPTSYHISKINHEKQTLEIKLTNTKRELSNKNKTIKDYQNKEKTKNKQIENLEKENKELKENVNKLKQRNEELPTSSIKSNKPASGRTQEITLSFYSTLASENGGYTTTCTGAPLKNGIVASNYYPLGTKININGQVFTVADRGGSHFDGPDRLDVLVERNYGEDPSEYLQRVNNLGKFTVTAHIMED